jgi:hypothetical protein
VAGDGVLAGGEVDDHFEGVGGLAVQRDETLGVAFADGDP